MLTVTGLIVATKAIAYCLLLLLFALVCFYGGGRKAGLEAARRAALAQAARMSTKQGPRR